MDALFKFWRWFGDSKIVNEDGTPKIVYHGTVVDFQDFAETRRRHRAFGFHFGSISQAEYFCGYGHHGRGRTWSQGNIRPVYLRIEEPLRTPDLYDRGEAEELAVWLRQNDLLRATGLRKLRQSRSLREIHTALATSIEEAGYNGIVYENICEGGTATTNEDSYIVFHPEQVKHVLSLAIAPSMLRASAHLRNRSLSQRFRVSEEYGIDFARASRRVQARYA